MEKQKFDLTGMTCSACSAAVERAVKRLDGVSSCEVHLLQNNMTLTYDKEIIQASDIISAVERAGYGARLKSAAKVARADAPRAEDEFRSVRWRLIWSFACLVPLMYIAMGPMMGLPVPQLLNDNMMVMALTQFLLCLPVAIVNSKYYRVGFKALVNLSPNMDSLIAVGSGAAIVYGVATMYQIALAGAHGGHMAELYFESAATILTLITLGKYFEERSKGRTTDAISKLMDLAPKLALVERDGAEVYIPVEDVALGDVVIIKPGAAVPVDGTVIHGSSAVDASMLTGESMPVDVSVGDKASQGTINLSGALRVRADKLSGDTALAQIVALVEEAGASKAPIGRLADRISGVFVPVVIAIAVVAAIIWYVVTRDIGFALSIGISVLVISCPCALGLATPVAIMVGTGRGAALGILFKSAEALETAHSVTVAVLDKTGTLTKGQPGVTDIIAEDEQSLMRLAYALERQSEHPLSRAVIAYSESRGAAAADMVDDFRAVPGRGVTATLDGSRASGGNAQLMRDEGIDITALETRAERLLSDGKTCLYFAKDGAAVGLIAVADELKPTSAEAVRQLIKMGIEPVMLTGDNAKAAQAVSAKLGNIRYVAEVMPADKEREVRRLQQDGAKVAMIGDGINDAPALTRADVGIAIGAGTDIAIESADVVLMKGDLMDAVRAISLGRAVIRNIKQNLFWAFFYNTIGIPLAAGVFFSAFGWKLNPMIGAAAMSLSSVCVVANALRLRRWGGVEPKSAKPPVQNLDVPDEVLIIEGMMCDNCVKHVKGALEKIPGVRANVSLSDNKADVFFDGAPVSRELLIENVEAEDYKVVR